MLGGRVSENLIAFRLLRLIRMPRLEKLIDINRFKKLIKSLFDSNS